MKTILEQIKKLPKASGVYIFKDKKGRVLYIGKAVNLRNRVRSHFCGIPKGQDFTLRQACTERSECTQGIKSWLGQIAKIETKKTNSEIEALILEAQLIKKYRPKYNVQWKDDKNYFYVGITNEIWPRIFVSHQPLLEASIKKQVLRKGMEVRPAEILLNFWRGRRKPDKSVKFSLGLLLSPNWNSKQYIGPFVDGQALKMTLRVLRKIFPYRSCRVLPKRPCLQYHMERCLAPCRRKLKIQNAELINQYRKNIQNLIKILTGKKKSVLKKLKQEMQKASQKQDFEKAAKIREQIQGLETILAHSQVIKPQSGDEIAASAVASRRPPRNDNALFHQRIEAYDISNISGQEATGSMVVFEKGRPKKSDYRRFKIKTVQGVNDVAMIQEVLRRRLKHPEWPWPVIILIDGGKPQLNGVRQIIKKFWPLNKCRPLLLGLAKKQEMLYTESKRQPLPLKNLAQGLGFLIQRIRDEAHRFAINYHHLLRTKKIKMLP